MLGVSLTGIILILFNKIPALAELPESSAPVLTTSFKRKTRKITPDFSGFSFEKFLHKTLSKSKVYVLKAEHKINNQLQKLRRKKKSKKKKDFGNDKYWDELKDEVEDE